MVSYREFLTEPDGPGDNGNKNNLTEDKNMRMKVPEP